MLCLPKSNPSRTLEEVIVALLVEEKRTTASETKGNSQWELAFDARNNQSRSTKDKDEIKCHYCKKLGHTTWNCWHWSNGILKGRWMID